MGKCRCAAIRETTDCCFSQGGGGGRGGCCTFQRKQLLQFSVSTEGERGSAEPLLPLNGRVGARLLHPHQLRCGRCFLGGALQETRVAEEGLHVTGEGRGQEVSARQAGNGEAITLRQSSRVNLGPARGGVRMGSARSTEAGAGGKVRGKKGSGGQGRTRGVQIPFRIRSGGSQQSNPITGGGVLCSIR